MTRGFTTTSHSLRLLRWSEFLVLGALAFWLLWAASLLRVEYYDGFDTISNARKLLLDGGRGFFALRSPGMAWLMLPVEWLKIHLGLAYEDMRLNHLLMAFVHFVALLFSYLGLVRINGRHWTSVLAFFIAFYSYVLLSYLPFISHDIAPGVLLLWMLILARDYGQQNQYKYFILLVILGSIGPLVKHTYALFWVLLLLVFGLRALWQKDRSAVKTWLHLLVMASLSAVLVWLVFARTFSGDFSHTPFLLRPIEALRPVFAQFGTTDSAEASLYLINIFAYGAAAIPLALLGIFLAWRRQNNLSAVARTQVIDTATLLVFFWFLMPLLGLREVRYLLFLTPLYAVLIARSLRLIPLRWLGLAAPLLLLQIFGNPWVSYPWPSAMQPLLRPMRPFYQGASFLPIVRELKKDKGAIAVYTPFRESPISMMDDEPLALRGDVFHGIFNLGTNHISQITGRKVLTTMDPAEIVVQGHDKKISVIFNQAFATRSQHPPGFCLNKATEQKTIIGQLQGPNRVVTTEQAEQALDAPKRFWSIQHRPQDPKDCFQIDAPVQAKGEIPLALSLESPPRRSIAIVPLKNCFHIEGLAKKMSAAQSMQIFSIRPEMILRLADQDWRQKELQDPALCPLKN